MINVDVIHECVEKKLPFPEAVKRLLAAGIERYYADLIKMEKIFYTRTGEYYVEPMLFEKMPAIGEDFNETKLLAALTLVQRGEIDYPTFIKDIIAAGAVNYSVYLAGGQAVYVGRKGENHIEKFTFSVK